MGVRRDAENPAEPLHREFIRIKKEGCGAAAYQMGRLPSILTGKVRTFREGIDEGMGGSWNRTEGCEALG